jgi:thymidylate synthase (FAD)
VKVELLSASPLPQLVESLRGHGIEVLLDALLPHVSFTFAVEGISRACSHQLVRHRVASYSQQSQRFVEVKALEKHVVVPSTISNSENAYVKFWRLLKETQRAYEDFVSLHVPVEDARFVLPNATETHLLVTMDGQELLHFFGLRCCNRAQWEIQLLANEMLREVLRVAPELFRRAGPYCYQRGHCDEGRFSCGRIEEVKAKYDKIREEIPQSSL